MLSYCKHAKVITIILITCLSSVDADTLNKCIKSIEGFCKYCHIDSNDVWTIGYGHKFGKGNIGKQLCCEAEPIIGDGSRDLKKRIQMYVRCVKNRVKVDLKDGQLAALVIVASDYGCGGLSKTQLLKLVNAGNYDAASKGFIRLDQPIHMRRIEKDLFDGASSRRCRKIVVCKQSVSECPPLSCEAKLQIISNVMQS